MALPKIHRLRHRRDFNRIYRAGLRRNSRHLALRALKIATPSHGQESRSISLSTHEGGARGQSCTMSPTRIGVTISTKVSKRAVVRNRIKRQIKSAMFQLLPMVSSGWLMVVIVRPGAVECDYWQFLRELEEMIKSLG